MKWRLKDVISIVSILIVCVILYSVISRILEGEEGRIKRLIYSTKRAIEREDLIRFISCVSFDYHDQYENDRRQILIIAKNLFNEYDNITIKITELEIELTGQSALAEIEAIGYGYRADAPDEKVLEYDKARFKVRFKKEQSGWKAIELEFLSQPFPELIA